MYTKQSGRLYDVGLSAMAQQHSCERAPFIRTKLSEDDILLLADIFLKRGFHRIKVEGIAEGRSIIYRLLRSMNCYHTIACLTSNKKPELHKMTINISRVLSDICGADASYESVEAFFLELWSVDFLWIECNTDMAHKPLFCHAMRAICELDIVHSATILAVSYET